MWITFFWWIQMGSISLYSQNTKYMFISTLLVALILLFLLYLLEENLYQKFVKFGTFNKKNYSDFVKKIRGANQITHTNDLIIAQWYVSNNWFSKNYNVILIFDKQGNFIKKYNETFSETNLPNVWVGVRI